MDVRQLMELHNKLDQKQKEIKTRLDKGQNNYTEEDIYKAMMDDVEVKKLLAQVKQIK